MTALQAAGIPVPLLLSGGYNATVLRKAGVTAAELTAAGYDALQLRFAGYTARQMLVLRFSVKELRQLGYSASELRAWPAVDDDRVGHSDEAIGVWSLAFYLTVLFRTIC